jgi:maleate cis-trans isomerase
VVQAFGKLNIALISHYPNDTMRTLADWFASHGIRTVSTETANLHELSAVRNLTINDVKRLAKAANCPEVELLCLVATDLPTFGLLQDLEDELGKPVISSNQAILWNALVLAGVREEIPGFGSLLRNGVTTISRTNSSNLWSPSIRGANEEHLGS